MLRRNKASSQTWHPPYWLLLGEVFLLILLEGSVFCLPAAAVLRQHHEAPGVLQYHSQISLQDRQKRAWQVVLFPEPQQAQPSTAPRYYLRLVAFPGLAEFEHSQALEITTLEGKVLFAPDTFSQAAPASNVGQYDVSAVLPQVKEALELSVPLKTQDLSLTIPQTIVTEWQWLVELGRSPMIQGDLSQKRYLDGRDRSITCQEDSER